MRNKKSKKGFTLVELLVVIAILAVLATVSVVGYMSFTKKAQVSNDESLVAQLNIALKADEATDGKPETPTEMLEVMEENGFKVENLTPTTSKYNIVWNQEDNQFALLDENDELVYGEAEKDSYKTWKFLDSYVKGTKYSIYLKGENTLDTIEASAGLDVGKNKSTSINYTNGTKCDNVVFNTNGGTLTVNAERDTVNHFGKANEVYVKKVDKNNSYHENGTVDLLTVEYGHVEIADNGKVTTMVVAPAAENDVTVTAKENQIDSVVAKGEYATSVVEDIKKDTGATTVNYGDTSTFDDSNYFINGYVQKNAFIILDQDYSFVGKKAESITMQMPSTKLIIDLNGKKFDLNSINLNNTCELTILDSIGTGEIYFHGKWSANGIKLAFDGANLKLNGGTLYANSEYTAEGYGSIVFMQTGTTFTMNGGKLVSNNASHNEGSLAVYMYNGNTKFVMNGGEIEKTAGTTGAVMASGSGSSGTTIEINDGTIKSNTVGIYHPQNGSLTVNGGHIEGETAIYVKCGSIKLNGGEFKATATVATDYQYQGSGCILTGDAVVIDACGYPDKNPVVDITGGKYVVSANGAHGIAHYKYNGNYAIITNSSNIEIFEKTIPVE